MILDNYLKQVDSLIEFLEDSVRQIRLHAVIHGEMSKEANVIQSRLSRILFECYMSFKEISIIKKKLKDLVAYLEDCDEITESVKDFIVNKYFSPDENYPISVLLSNYILVIEESFEMQKLSNTAFFQMFTEQTPDMVIAEAERDANKQEIINSYESFLTYMDKALGMVYDKKEPIDILLYLKQNVL